MRDFMKPIAVMIACGALILLLAPQMKVWALLVIAMVAVTACFYWWTIPQLRAVDGNLTKSGAALQLGKALAWSVAVLLAFVIGVWMFATLAYARSPYIVSPDGHYLGNLSSNQYDPDSVSNPYGRYGSQYSPDSVNNPYGKYGSPYSNYSPNNPYATQAPMIMSPDGY